MKETQGDQSGNEIQTLRPGPKKLLNKSPIQAQLSPDSKNPWVISEKKTAFLGHERCDV
jgi:hypothetical protein